MLSRAPRFVIFSFVPFFSFSQERVISQSQIIRERERETVKKDQKDHNLVLKQLIDRTGVEKETEYISSETLQKEKFEEKCPKLKLKVILPDLFSKLIIWKSKMSNFEVEMTFF